MPRAATLGMALASLLSVGPSVAAAQPVPATAPADRTLATIARLQYGGGGDWYADPSSLPNLLRRIGDDLGIEVAGGEAVVTASSPDLHDYPYLYMTGHGNVRFTEQDVEGLRRYLLSGGFLHADDNYGMDESFRREIARLFPDNELVPVPIDHPVYRIVHALPAGLPKIHEHDGEPAQAFGIFHDGRLLVFYSHQTDLGDGWEDADVHGNPPEAREAALRMGVNLYAYAIAQPRP